MHTNQQGIMHKFRELRNSVASDIRRAKRHCYVMTNVVEDGLETDWKEEIFYQSQ
jgi:hypothetical protein